MKMEEKWYGYEWDEDKNEDVKEALKWAEWLSAVKDPGPALSAAKKHGNTFLKCYRMMSLIIQDSEYRVV